MTFWTPSACDQCAENLVRTTGKRCNAWPILLQRLHIELLAEADSVHSENPLPPGCTPFVDMTSASLSLSVSSTACLKNSCGISSLDKTNISQNMLPFLWTCSGLLERSTTSASNWLVRQIIWNKPDWHCLRSQQEQLPPDISITAWVVTATYSSYSKIL